MRWIASLWRTIPALVLLGGAFTARAADPDPVLTTLAVQWREGDWVGSDWIGAVYAEHAPWYWFQRLGRWAYASADAAGGLWLYDHRLGWTWTGPDAWPWGYCLDGKGWYYRDSSTRPQRFWGGREHRWFDLDAGFDWLEPQAWRALEGARARYAVAMGQVPANRYPYQLDLGTGQWVVNSSSNWTSGFFPASLLKLYEWTGEAAFWEDVVPRLADLQSQKSNTTTHDVGFMIGTPFILAYAVSGETAYRDIALAGAASLATRFDPTIGSIDSWDWGDWANYHETIVDNMMNLELLFWAARQSGGDPAWKAAATSHADLTARELVRADGSVIHVVAFDRASGEVAFKTDFSGRPESGAVFARGQAWAIYGYTVAFRETGEVRFYDTARALLDYFWAHLRADGVPWFELAQVIPASENDRDASASAIAAAALWQLVELAPPEDRPGLEARARTLLEALLAPEYFASGPGTGLLYYQTNDRSTPTKVETAISYGDFYLLQAIGRYLERRSR